MHAALCIETLQLLLLMRLLMLLLLDSLADEHTQMGKCIGEVFAYLVELRACRLCAAQSGRQHHSVPAAGVQLAPQPHLLQVLQTPLIPGDWFQQSQMYQVVLQVLWRHLTGCPTCKQHCHLTGKLLLK